MFVLTVIDSLIIFGGQLCWKLGIKTGSIKSLRDLIYLLFNFNIMVGTALYILGTILWFYIISKFEFSKVYPMLSMTYVFGIIAGKVIFQESMSSYKLSGVVIIIIGIFIINIK